MQKLEINPYGFFEADTDTSTIHGLIANTANSRYFQKF